MIEQHRVVGVSCFKHTTTDPSGILLLLVQAPISIFLSINIYIYIYEYICIHKQIHSPRVVLVDIQGQGGSTSCHNTAFSLWQGSYR